MDITNRRQRAVSHYKSSWRDKNITTYPHYLCRKFSYVTAVIFMKNVGSVVIFFSLGIYISPHIPNISAPKCSSYISDTFALFITESHWNKFMFAERFLNDEKGLAQREPKAGKLTSVKTCSSPLIRVN